MKRFFALCIFFLTPTVGAAQTDTAETLKEFDAYLDKTASQLGDSPFAAVISKNGEILYERYFDGAAELYDIQRDPDEFVNLAGDLEYAGVIERLQLHLPEEPQWKHFVRYRNFKAIIPSDGSPMLLYNMAYRNQVNEQDDVAEDYPEIVTKIEDWLAIERPDTKYLSMAK